MDEVEKALRQRRDAIINELQEIDRQLAEMDMRALGDEDEEIGSESIPDILLGSYMDDVVFTRAEMRIQSRR